LQRYRGINVHICRHVNSLIEIAILTRAGAFQQILNYPPSHNMRTKILCRRNEKKINQKFAWLKLVSVNISHTTMYENVHCNPSDVAIIICYRTKLKFLLSNGFFFNNITFKILNKYNRFPYTCYQHFHKWHMAKICGRHLGQLFKITRRLDLCFWQTRKRSQPTQGDLFVQIAL
jgi:hypothetical protein